ncbi:apoptosis regulatory protein Siva-like [Pogonomyrmex barbatus]|uniref:Apoptosis regulatory protein Siva-like n=1 Tax=Pogonomyrmex barbatus TaxID=144034 RepID=A0A6I9WNJ2_9HYME|nr:apoptosis regulatory protein Siva-like [Pogonomyrmex barbatus]
MPKRAYPFEENLLPQMKVHVGQKQVDNGVSSDQRMKDIYDRTLSLLKAGAKALAHKLDTSAQDFVDLPSLESSLPCRSKSNLKQMLLTNKLKLKTNDKVINDMRVELCTCCRLIDRFTVNTCHYCDQALCSSCLSICADCSELFCQNCSLPVYNCKEQVMCLNCYR